MTIASDIHADLITPLGAYLRLAAEGGATFLLESVEKGRLGRYSLVGRGARIVDFSSAERELAAGSPVVGYLAYDHIAELEPTVPLPDEGVRDDETAFGEAGAVVRQRYGRFQLRDMVVGEVAHDRASRRELPLC